MFRMTVSDVFFITGRGLVATGKVEEGTLNVGDEVLLNGGAKVRVDAIEAFRKTLEQAVAGDNVGVLLRGVDRGDVNAGDVLTSGGQAAAGRDPRFAQAEAQRVQFVSMRESGLMSDEQIDAALRAAMFSAEGRHWLLNAGGDWSSSDGSDWKHDSPPG
jgi:translation elongation factor EF-1alpha